MDPTGAETTEVSPPANATREANQGAPRERARLWRRRHNRGEASDQSRAHGVRQELAAEDADARLQRERDEEAQFKANFEDSARRVRLNTSDPEHMTVAQAANRLNVPPEVFTLFLNLDTGLTAYKRSHDAGERKVIIKEIVEQCFEMKPREEGKDPVFISRMNADELDAFIRKMRPDVGADERREIVASLRVEEASLPENAKEEVPDYERREIERDLKEADAAGRVVRDTLAQKTAEWVSEKMLVPMHDWLEAKKHKLEHWLTPDEPGKVWLKRGGKLLLTLVKFAFYTIIWMMAIANRMSGKGSKGH